MLSVLFTIRSHRELKYDFTAVTSLTCAIKKQ